MRGNAILAQGRSSMSLKRVHKRRIDCVHTHTRHAQSITHARPACHGNTTHTKCLPCAPFGHVHVTKRPCSKAQHLIPKCILRAHKPAQPGPTHLLASRSMLARSAHARSAHARSAHARSAHAGTTHARTASQGPRALVSCALRRVRESNERALDERVSRTVDATTAAETAAAKTDTAEAAADTSASAVEEATTTAVAVVTPKLNQTCRATGQRDRQPAV